MVEEDTLELDRLYKQTDALYYELARDCGLSGCAYWLLYGVEAGGGQQTQARLADQFAYSRQTVNSALKTLMEKGLVRLAYREGSKRDKLVSFTESGHMFSRRYIVPAIEAEARALGCLTAKERSELMRLVGAYTSAIDSELEQLRSSIRGEVASNG